MLLHYLKDEEDSFFCLIHVLKVHDWRGCYAPETPKLIQFLEFLDCVLESAYTEIYKHIMDEIEISISPAFISNIQTIFIRKKKIYLLIKKKRRLKKMRLLQIISQIKKCLLKELK